MKPKTFIIVINNYLLLSLCHYCCRREKETHPIRVESGDMEINRIYMGRSGSDLRARQQSLRFAG